MSTTSLMGRKRTAEQPAADRHKPRKMIAIRKQFHDQAEVLRVRLGLDDLTELANLAVRELLERNGLWPPKESP